MIEGTLDTELGKRWAWDRDIPKPDETEPREWRDLVNKSNDRQPAARHFTCVVDPPSK